MNIDTMLSLSLSLYSNKGAYALLLGSGVSRTSGIPTGWEVVIDLIEKIAQLSKEKTEGNTIEWFTKKFNEEPNYSVLISKLAKTPEERKGLLKGYFEPTEQEREEGIKVPTLAHKAIAKLVSLGYIKVIVTTNFDRLIEKALEMEGIIPVVISTPDMVIGSSPLHNNRCTVIKVNGDYLDSRMRNTTNELQSYEKEINTLLEQVFNEYGLIISGWSGEWDNGLVEALNRRNNKRFSSYWTIRGELGEVGKRLVAQKEFDIVHISDADTFFSELLEKVTSLQDINANHPLSPKVASATVKRYLVDEKYKIRLSDYVLQEAKNLKGKISPTDFPFNVRMLQMEIYPRTKSYEELVQILQAMFIVGFYWGKPEQLNPFLKAFSLIANPPRPDGTFTTALQNLSYYPGLLLFYSAGIASVANNNYKALHQLFSLPITRNDIKRQGVYILQPTFVLENDLGKMLRRDKNEFTPTSNHLFDILRPSLSEIFPSDDDYQATFDKFEYLLSLSSADIRLVANENGWGSIGCFSWRGDTRKEILEEYSLHKEEWIVLKNGLFGGSMERFRAARQAIEDLIGRLNIY